MFKKIKSYALSVSAATTALVVGSPAFAATPTSALELANGISFADITVVLFTLAGLLMSFIGIKKGIELVVGWFSRIRA